MDILRIVGVTMAAIAISVTLRALGRNDMALLTSLAAGTLILFMILGQMGEAARAFYDVAAQWSTDNEITLLLIKVTGIAIAAELASQLCRDAGEGGLAQKTELAGKVMILCAALPILRSLYGLVYSLLPS